MNGFGWHWKVCIRAVAGKDLSHVMAIRSLLRQEEMV